MAMTRPLMLTHKKTTLTVLVKLTKLSSRPESTARTHRGPNKKRKRIMCWKRGQSKSTCFWNIRDLVRPQLSVTSCLEKPSQKTTLAACFLLKEKIFFLFHVNPTLRQRENRFTKPQQLSINFWQNLWSEFRRKSYRKWSQRCSSLSTWFLLDLIKEKSIDHKAGSVWECIIHLKRWPWRLKNPKRTKRTIHKTKSKEWRRMHFYVNRL